MGVPGSEGEKTESLLERWEKIEGESESGRGPLPSPGWPSWCGWEVLAQGTQRQLLSTDNVSWDRDGVRGKQKWRED